MAQVSSTSGSSSHGKAGRDPYPYQSGLGNTFSTEALPGALPAGQNSPQRCPYGLYAEQLSGTAFTVPRRDNKRTWVYRISPSVSHRPYTRVGQEPGEPGAGVVRTFQEPECQDTPNQLRWSPFTLPEGSEALDFVQGLRTLCGAGDPASRAGLAIHAYLCNRSMERAAFYSSDGDWLILPQSGTLDLRTELGWLRVRPGELAVVPRGIRYAVTLVPGTSSLPYHRGYVLEVFDGHFELPDLGPIGANGLANPRDFLSPCAAYDQPEASASGKEVTILCKYRNAFYTTFQPHTPFDVVAWHGNLAPFKYDLSRFNAINTVSFDHPDPSIFTVLTVRSPTPGVALADFVIFPPRWMVAEHTFRPPYFHRNCMSEFMGLLSGAYDAKAEGFLPGGASLHNIMTAHGPDRDTFAKASQEDLVPVKLRPDGLAFMFESCHFLTPSKWALERIQTNYYQCWEAFPVHFTPDKP